MQRDALHTIRRAPNVISYLLSISVGILTLLAVIILTETTSAQSALHTPHSALRTPNCDPDWRIVPGAVISPTTSDTLEAAAVASANDAWAVGEYTPVTTTQT